MSHPKNEEFVINTRPAGTHDLKETWKLQEVEYPTIKNDGEFIYKALFISVDPYLSSQIGNTVLSNKSAQRGLGQPQISHVTSEVVESRNPDFPVGTIFYGHFPWRRYSLSNGKDFPRKEPGFVKIVKKPGEASVFDGLPLISSIGALGMPSQTAYYGSRDVGKFNENDVLVVSGAAGATGSVVGQIAKKIQKVKKVIGIAGGEEKCKHLKDIGFDVALDYKKFNTQEKMAAALKEAAGADPITAYFDNTGGFVTDAVFDVIARHGRLIICGQISGYHNVGDSPADVNKYPNYLGKTIYAALTIQGFLWSDFVYKNDEDFYQNMPGWVKDKKIITSEHVLEGFDKLPEAYSQLYSGSNIGKIIVKV